MTRKELEILVKAFAAPLREHVAAAAAKRIAPLEATLRKAGIDVPHADDGANDARAAFNAHLRGGPNE